MVSLPHLSMAVPQVLLSILSHSGVSALLGCFNTEGTYSEGELQPRGAACAEQLCWKRACLSSATTFGLTEHREQILLPGRIENFSYGICKAVFLDFFFPQNSDLF